MQREDPQSSASCAQASGQGNRTLQEFLQDINLSEFSEAQLDAFINSLTGPGISKVHFRKLLLYVLKFVEYNRAKYERLKTELQYLKEELASLNDDLMTVMVSHRIPPLPSAPQAAAPTQPSAPQAAAPTQPSAPQAAAPTQPSAPQAAAPAPPSVPRAMASIPPLASQATAAPVAFQAMVLSPALQAMATGPIVSSSTFSLPILNADGTISRKMDQVGNNVTVTFSGNDEMASKKSKLFGSSAKLDTFTGHDISQFPEWVAQFLSGVNLFQPMEPSACKVALHLLRGKAAEMAKRFLSKSA